MWWIGSWCVCPGFSPLVRGQARSEGDRHCVGPRHSPLDRLVALQVLDADHVAAAAFLERLALGGEGHRTPFELDDDVAVPLHERRHTDFALADRLAELHPESRRAADQAVGMC